MGSYTMIIGTLLIIASISTALPQKPQPSTAATATTSTAVPQPTQSLESGEYYPSAPNGQSYNNNPLVGNDPTVDTSSHGNDGRSDAFMGLPVPALVGIIAAVVVLAIVVFMCTVLYYYSRKRQWEVEMREGAARGAANRVGKKSLESFAERGELKDSEDARRTTTPTPDLSVKSEFEGETVKGGWRRWILRK